MSDQEVARRYPCDDLVSEPVVSAWRGVTVARPPEAVWPWVTQIRLAPYSYDWVDNLGRRSPRTLRGLPEPVVGESFSSGFGRRRGQILAVHPGESLTGRIMGTTMSYLLVPHTEGTRLLLKLVTPSRHRFASMLPIADLPMARRQLLTFASLAEGRIAA